MKILQIRFLNLNSLKGEWRIDLTHPAYLADGIFAITGPTGAGKTTLLDALCLALYGCTPRLGKVTQSVNDIMSRQTGECFAEAVFETAAGRFRCHWSQHRARKKPGGALQAPRHEVANADTGRLIESSVRATPDCVEQLTGMDFTRFTRSMLLAQGSFAAFLQAGASERGPVLEQITGTAIYSQISVRTYELLKQVRDQVMVLKAETEGIVQLDSEQEAQLRLELEQALVQEAKVRQEAALTLAYLEWLARVQQLTQEVCELEGDSDRLQAECEAFKPKRMVLERAHAAASISSYYELMFAARTNNDKDTTSLAERQAVLPQLEQTVAELTAQADGLAEQVRVAREALEHALPLLQQVRTLDQQVAVCERDMKVATRQCEEASAQLQRLESAVKTVDEGVQAVSDARRHLAELEGRHETAVQALNRALDGRLLREYRAEKEALLREQALVARITALEDERTRLRCGHPCPLCGALEHPYTQGRVPSVQDFEPGVAQLAERIAQAEALETAVQRLEVEMSVQRERIATLTMWQTQVERVQQVSLERQQAQQRYTEALAQRQAVFGARSVDDEERRLQKAIEQALNTERQLQQQLAAQTGLLTAAQAHIQSLQDRRVQNEQALEQATAAFVAACVSAGFVDEAAFLAARLPAPELAHLQAQARALDERHTMLMARLKDRRDRLEVVRAQQLTTEPVDVLEARRQTLHNALAHWVDLIATLRHRLSEDEQAKARYQTKLSEINARMADCERWEALNALIGSADGKKFQKFAQGLTFEIMVGHANRQLQKMTDRYVLVRETNQPLELNVIDMWQGAEVRSTRNLSGGESFIVSLALALGLSSMASHKVRVDSLFLDEGFGTLDEDALEIALETLAGLHQEGKLIGIISHVSALKDRISTRIRVVPAAGGTSVLQGPGCAAGP